MQKPRLAHILFALATAIVFLLLPQSITTPAQYGNTVFVVGLGIDKSEQMEGLSLCAQIVAAKPNAASSESYQIVTSDGKDMIEAMDNMRKELGKLLGISHCYVVIVSDEVCDEYNLVTLFDPLVRTEHLGTNVILAHTNNKAKDLLLACDEIGGDAQNVLENLTKYNYEYVINKDASIYDFYKNYFSPHATGLMVTLDCKDQDQQQADGNTSSGGSGANSSQSGQSQTQSDNTLPKKIIVNRGEGVAFYKGKKVALIDKELLKGLGWLDTSSKYSNIKLEHINTSKLQDATITLSQLGCDLNYTASINNNIPTLYVDFTVDAKIIGIQTSNLVTVTDLASYFDDAFTPALQQLVATQLDQICEFQRENKLDILNFYKIFNTQIHSQWQNYLSSLEDPSDYATQVQVFVKTKLKQVN